MYHAFCSLFQLETVYVHIASAPEANYPHFATYAEHAELLVAAGVGLFEF